LLTFSLMPWVGTLMREHRRSGLPLYVAVFWVLGGIAFLSTTAWSPLGGWAFGLKLGLPAALAAYAGASLVGHHIALCASGERCTEIIREHPRWDAVYGYLLGRGFWRTVGVIILVRLPNTPFGTGNVIFAAARVRRLPFLLGTIVGIAPRTAAGVYFGTGLQHFDLRHPHDSVPFAIGFAVAAVVIVILGLLARRALAQVTAGDVQR
jgi:uncharacterized membrane protein YdjX (TVP38/TMEM64 family)